MARCRHSPSNSVRYLSLLLQAFSLPLSGPLQNPRLVSPSLFPCSPSRLAMGAACTSLEDSSQPILIQVHPRSSTLEALPNRRPALVGGGSSDGQAAQADQERVGMAASARDRGVRETDPILVNDIQISSDRSDPPAPGSAPLGFMSDFHRRSVTSAKKSCTPKLCRHSFIGAGGSS